MYNDKMCSCFQEIFKKIVQCFQFILRESFKIITHCSEIDSSILFGEFIVNSTAAHPCRLIAEISIICNIVVSGSTIEQPRFRTHSDTRTP